MFDTLFMLLMVASAAINLIGSIAKNNAYLGILAVVNILSAFAFYTFRRLAAIEVLLKEIKKGQEPDDHP